MMDSILGFSIAPMRLVTFVGFSVSLVSFVYAIFIVVTSLAVGSPVPGFPTIVALVALLSGVSLFVTGMIGEYVWRVFDEVNRRPESLVEHVFEPTSSENADQGTIS